MKKLLLFICIIILTPSVTLAAWWNPFSWNIFYARPQQIQIASTTTQSNQISTDNSASTTIVAASTTVAESPIVPISKPIKKIPPPISTPSQKVQVKIPQQIQPTGTLCNGTYWASCPTGQSLTCPSTGDAYCHTTQESQSVQQPQVVQTKISSMNNTSVSGQGFTTAYSVYLVPVDVISKIDLPFTVINDHTIYLAYTTDSVPPAPGKYNAYVASLDGGISAPYQTEIQDKGIPYKGGDGNWYYPNAFDEKGRNLQAPTPSCPEGYSLLSLTNLGRPVCSLPPPSPTCALALQHYKDFQKRYDVPAYKMSKPTAFYSSWLQISREFENGNCTNMPDNTWMGMGG